MFGNQAAYHKLEKTAMKRVYYTGTDTLKGGYALCYDRDNITATNVAGTALAADSPNYARHGYVEKPAAGNLDDFAGLVAPDFEEKTGPCFVDIVIPTAGFTTMAWTEELAATCIAETTYLSLKAADYELGLATEGPIVAKALQTAGSAAGLVQVEMLPFGPIPQGAGANLAGTAITVPSSTVNVASGVIWNDCPWDLLAKKAIPGHVYFNDYLNTIDVTTADGYVVTGVTTGQIIADVVTDGGVLVVDSAGNGSADDGANVQLQNCLFKSAANRKIWFEARMQCTDTSALKDQIYVGLAGIDTTLIAAGIMDDVVDKCGFMRLGASTADKISCITARTSADDATADVATVADATWVNVGFVIDGLTSVKFYVNGVLVETGTTVANIPNAVMCLSYVAQTEGAAADTELWIDWVKIAQQN